jgi:LuxR family maltose regulon positive regulatory protein
MIRPVRPDGSIETGGVFVPIPRRRVLERIASAAMQRVVLIVAPAGYGKSVALRQYLDGVDAQFVRFDVLPDNAGLLGFLRGFSDALDDIAPDARTTLAGAYEKNAASASPGTDLALWMHSHLKSYRGVIAIDDLHVAQDDREVTRFLSSLIDRTKGRVQWVIASRSTLGLPIGTWLAYGDSDLAIDEHDLKFSVEEARDAARAFRLAVRDEELYELLNLTDGWATAMSFALRSSTRSVDLRNVSSMTREMVYHYLAEQVYATLSDSEREFVETAALLHEIDIDLLVRAGFDNAMPMLENLRQRVAFLQEQSNGTFRMHDLFADFVLHQLQFRGSEAARALGRRVGGVLESAQRPVDALRLYVSAASHDDVIRILDEHGIALISQGFSDEISAALEFASSGGTKRSSTLDGLNGLIALMRGRFDEGERLLNRALRGELTLVKRAEFLLRLAIHQSNRGKAPTEPLEQFLAENELDLKQRLDITSHLASLYASYNRLEDARALVLRIEAAVDEVADEGILARVLLRLGNVAMFDSQLAKSRELLTRSADIAAREGEWGIACRAYHSLAIQALMSENDTALSLWCEQQASAAATRAGDYLGLQHSLLGILSIETRRGNAERAISVEKQLSELNKSDASIGNFMISSQAHRRAWAEQFADAHRMFGTIRGRQYFASDRVFIEAAFALCLALDGQAKASADAVTSALAELDANADGKAILFDFALLFVALAEVLSGRHTAAGKVLRRVQSEKEAVRAFAAGVAELLQSGINRAHEVTDIQEIHEAVSSFGFGGYSRYLLLAQSVMSRKRVPDDSVALTPSELIILRALADGRTPKEVAAEMGRSVLTVQTHIQNIIRKFGGHGRSEAIATARRMGLL